MRSGFWDGRRVFVTGHTGFKGAWLCCWLLRMGAQVTGYALPAPTRPNLFAILGLEHELQSLTGDVRDLTHLRQAMQAAQPEVVFHLAAQSLVRRSYQDPVETYGTNVMGTVHLLEAVRACACVSAVVNVTSDKCYDNREWVWGYRENDPMGGFDPYSNSKGCAELVTDAWRNSFFPPDRHGVHGVALASVRAGNVIGGGDWAEDRLVPDALRALYAGLPIEIRSPDAVRPWQHVLEPLSGYLALAERLFREGPRFAGGWNFGPEPRDARPVRWVVQRLVDGWGEGAHWRVPGTPQPHEAAFLRLDCSKARALLQWAPRWTLETAIDRILAWHRGHQANADMRALTHSQIEDFIRHEPHA